MTSLTIIEDDLSGDAIAALLRLHLDEMYKWTPAESVHAMSIERLREPDVTFFSAWAGDALAGCGALKEIDATHGEIKSMRAAPAFRGKGVGGAILTRLLAVARDRGYRRISLETGSEDHYEPARKLYLAGGFVVCEPFADYLPDPLSVFMTKYL
ncbi:MAG: GNAT family N-acetyltransferase [Novosphingobium sp.]|nr:GNAT family N-acetyltransferase [Novosphingobium sp.]